MKKQVSLLLLFLPFFCFSQNTTTQYFKGRIDDFHDIKISLTCHENDCTGEMKYLRNQIVFQLNGKRYGDYIELTEIDSSGNISGRIKGNITAQKIDAQWTNYDQSIQNELILSKSKASDEQATYCGENKWINQYTYKNGEEYSTFLIQLGSNNHIFGTINRNGRLYKIQGELDSKNHFLGKLKSEDGQVSSINSPLHHARTTKITFKDNNPPAETLPFKIRDQIEIGCVRYADYITTYDATYPKTKNAAFNDWIEKQIFEWANNCKYRATINKQKLPLPELRATERATAYVDLTYLSKTIISGFVIFNNYEQEQSRSISFTFDLKKGIVIIEKDLFKPHFNLKDFTKKVAVNFFKNHHLYSDEDFKAWIEIVEFPHFTIQKEGICFWTDFDLIYGQQRMLIPYIELAQFFRPDFPAIE